MLTTYNPRDTKLMLIKEGLGVKKAHLVSLRTLNGDSNIMQAPESTKNALKP